MRERTWSTFFNDISVLIIGSLVGVQVRLLLQHSFHWLLPAPIFSLSAAQFLGCAVMGFTVGAQSNLVRIHPSTYLLLTTGVAGSITSFSSWAVQLSEMLTEQLTTNRVKPITSDSEQVRQYLHEAVRDQAEFQLGRRLLNPWQIYQKIETIGMWSRLLAFAINAIITLALAQAGFLFGLHVGQSIERMLLHFRSTENFACVSDQRLQQMRQEHKLQRLHFWTGLVYKLVALISIAWLTLSVALHLSGLSYYKPNYSINLPTDQNQSIDFKNDPTASVQVFSPLLPDELTLNDTEIITNSINHTWDKNETDANPEIDRIDFMLYWNNCHQFFVTWLLPNKRMTATLLFAPCGTILRWKLSLLFNNRLTCFVCLGTFLANISASLLAFALHLICVDLNQPPTVLLSESKQLLPLIWAARDGFCGCLSTVSTFIGELIRLRRASAYIYGCVSVLGIPAINIILLCFYIWINPQMQFV